MVYRPVQGRAHTLFPCERGKTALVRLRFGQGWRHLHACRGVSAKQRIYGAGEVHSGSRQHDGDRMEKARLSPEADRTRL